jgi:hypothetical protein
MLSFAQ